MSNTKKEKNLSVFYDGFGGMDHSSRHGKRPSADNILNFRILKDGSLEKRCGFRHMFFIGEGIRALYGVTEKGKYILYALIGSDIYAIDPEDNSRRFLGTVSTSTGNALFFNYRGLLFLTDGHDLFKYSGAIFTGVYGYVPLFGKDWGCIFPGEVYEPRNILNRRVRISYLIPDPPSPFLSTKYSVESVEAVYLNGDLLDSGRYSLNNEFLTLDISGLEANDRLEVYLTFRDGLSSLLRGLLSAKHAAIFGGIGNNRIFLCGENSKNVFISKPISADDLEISQKHYPNSDFLYFPESGVLDIGNGVNRISGITRHRDKLLIFTEGDVWLAYPESSNEYTVCASSVNSEIGCVLGGGAISVGNDTVSIEDRAVWLWSDYSSSVGSCNASLLSSAIQDELSENGLSNYRIFHNKSKNEIWIYSSSSEVCFIYSIDNKAWYKFSGISAELMLELNGQVAFVKDGHLFIFDETLGYDSDTEGVRSNIIASYTSKYLDFGNEDMKNLYSAILHADLGGDALTLSFSDDDESSEYSFTLRGSGGHSIIKKRIFSGRFKHTRFTISSTGLCRQSIQSLTLTTR